MTPTKKCPVHPSTPPVVLTSTPATVSSPEHIKILINRDVWLLLSHESLKDFFHWV